MVSYKLEENIQSYLIYLLTTNEEDYKALTVRSKPWQVALVIFLTQIIQCYALSIMYLETGLFDGSITYYSTDN